MVVRRHDMFENWPVTQSSQHAQDEEANMAASVQNEQFYSWNYWILAFLRQIRGYLCQYRGLYKLRYYFQTCISAAGLFLSEFVRGC